MQELQLKPLSKNGQPPKTRLATANETAVIVDQLIEDNDKRCYNDASVKGLFDGNPPYDQASLDSEAQSWRCNRNWRIGESFLQIALSIYWDIVSEGPTKATCMTDWGDSDGQNQDWSGVITEEFERLNKLDSSLNYMFRLSQHDMVLYRMGPVMWQDAFDYRATPIKCSNLLTLLDTPSNIDDWELAVVRVPYRVDKLYGFIRNEEAAKASGWNVKFAKQLLMKAVPLALYPNRRHNWEWFQQRIRNNDISLGLQSQVIPVAHTFVKEFAQPGEAEGRVSQFCTVEGMANQEYLFQRIGRYANWRQAICPFYYDTGDGGHHSVKGLGIKAYGALEMINRLMCHEIDLAFIGSALNFQFRNASDKEKMKLMQLGPVNFWDEGINFLQTNQTGQLIQAPSYVRQQVLSTVTSNLAQYRQGLEQEKGNPITAREVNWRAENQNFIAKSGVSFYFEQEDLFYAERFRRAANPNLTEHNCGGREALEFQRRCLQRKVPMEALQKMGGITATRTVGWGSADARLQTMLRMLEMLPLYSEAGRERVIEDLTAMMVGQTLKSRYIPETKTSNSIEFQRSQAQDKIALIKAGVVPIVTSDQNPMVYAETFITAAAQALESVTQGANPAEVIGFVDMAGQSAAMHLQRMANDPTRKKVFDALTEQLEQIGKNKDELQKMLQQQMQQSNQLQQRAGEQDGELALKAKDIESKIALATAKTRSALQQKQAKHEQAMEINAAKTQQGLLLADATTAAEITRKNRNSEPVGK